MSILTLQLIDPATIDPDGDIWADRCASCGSLDNHGELICTACDGELSWESWPLSA